MNKEAKAAREDQKDERTFAQQIERVRQIVEALEGNSGASVDLEEGARLYKEASACLAFCRSRLDAVRNEIERADTGEVEEDEAFLSRGK